MKKVYIIAEAGVNHNGSIEIAKRLIDVAKESGADAVKFQTFKADKLLNTNTDKAAYQKISTGTKENQFEMIKNLELSREAFYILARYCEKKKIEFLSTAFDLESIDLLNNIGVRIWKIPSGEITNLPFLRKIGSFNKPIILSTGMACLADVESALLALEESGTPRKKITILHCTTEYPTPFNEVNLNAMVIMGKAFGVDFGYSDHTPGIAIPIAATALGAVLIEKHFTLDKKMEGPDHRASLEPKELKEMVSGIRAVQVSLGDGIKRPMKSELQNRVVVRKSIVAARKINTGEKFSINNLTAKRPATGISPMEWDRVIGREASREYDEGEAIEW